LDARDAVGGRGRGVASRTSVAPLEQIQFFVDVVRSTFYSVDIYRIEIPIRLASSRLRSIPRHSARSR
jgi:hypothetical protein